MPPSPNLHDLPEMVPVDASVKVTGFPARGETGLEVKETVIEEALEAADAAWTYIDLLILIDLVPAQAVRVTL